MAKDRVISFRTDSETEHKLNFLLQINCGMTTSDILELAIHNEWASENYANLSLITDLEVDELYTSMIENRIESNKKD